MKSFSATQAIFAALFILKVVMPFSSRADQRVNAVIFRNEVIPAVELKEVVIVAERPTTLCKTINHDGELIPLVEMKEVSISASGDKVKDDEGALAVHIPGIRTLAVEWRGEMIPHVDGPEVTVIGTRNQDIADRKTTENQSEQEVVYFRTSVRQTFDRIGSFILDQTKEILKTAIPRIF